MSVVPVIEFMETEYRVDEEEETVSVPVTRTGDLSYVSSVICYTRQHSASVAVDYEERTFTDDSRLTFAPGEKAWLFLSIFCPLSGGYRTFVY